MRPFLLLLSAAFCLLLSMQAQAGLSVCNDTDTRASVAIGYKAEDGRWTSEGWWVVEPNNCARVVGGDLPKRYYYWHATTRAGTFETANYMFCTSPKEFTIQGDKNCDIRGYDRVGFNQLDVGDATDFTFRLTPSALSKGALFGGPPGTYGEPYSLVVEFLGCWAVAEELQCEFTTDGWTYVAFDTDPTDPDIIDDLQNFSPGAFLEIEGDMISYEGGTARITLRDFDIAPDDAPAPAVSGNQPYDAVTIQNHMQGYWESEGDSAYYWIVDGNQIDEIYDGNLMRRAFFEIAPSCAASYGDGPVIIAYPETDEGEGPACYLVGELGPRSLQVLDLLEGVTINLRYQE